MTKKLDPLIKLILNLVSWPLYGISSAIPKSKNVWIFGAWRGRSFSDNSKHLYLYIKDHQKDINAIWITKDRKLAIHLRNTGVNAFYFASLHGLYYQCISSAAFFTHHQNTEFFSPLLSKGTKLFQLWHGTPLKKIHLDTPEYQKARDSGRRKIVQKVFPWRRNLWDFVISPSEEVSKNLRTAFSGNNIIVTGYPRNDRITATSHAKSISKINKIIYMPTFRGKNSTEESNKIINKILSDSGFHVTEVENKLQQRNIELTIRLHPSNTLNSTYLEAINNSTSIKVSPPGGDIYDTIDEFDILITDYSSIAFDFILSGKPLIQIGFDLKEYTLNSRELYYSFDEICLTPRTKNWNDIFRLIDDIKNHAPPADYFNKYNYLAHMTNKFFDRLSCQRVYEHAITCIQEKSKNN